MTSHNNISHDDVLDVVEMTEKLEKIIDELFDENSRDLVFSSIMNASIYSILKQCETMERALFYKNMFMRVFDNSIKSIKIKKKEKE
jgi:hypothetical protein